MMLASTSKSAALIVVDQQLDFEPGGALAVAEGDLIVQGIVALLSKFETVVFTQDSHPEGHISFASSYQGKKPFDLVTLQDVQSGVIKSNIFTQNELETYLKSVPSGQQVLWPDHCVQGTKGASFDPRLPTEKAHLILRKGTRRDCDSYSGFFENDGSPTGLSGYLRSRGVSKVTVVGLAGDYCVAWTAKDAKAEGFEIQYLKDLTRFVNFPQGSAEKALSDLKDLGVSIV